VTDGRRKKKGKPAPQPEPPIPNPESVISEHEFVSPKGTKYKIIKTTETDPGEEPKPPKGRRGKRQ
jgi:hypothetical protein